MIGKHWTTLALAACFAAFVSGAHAQVNPESCGEIRDPDTEFQMNLCTAHVGCGFVFKIQKVCAQAKGFLDKMRDTLTGRREITNNDVFEAAAPEARPVPALTRYIDTAREAVRSAFNDPANRQKQEVKTATGNRVYYEGGLNNGKREGAGVWINENGAMGRGKMKDDRMNGDGQDVSPNGAISAGNYQNTVLQGPAAVQVPSGIVFTGNMNKGEFTGYVTSNRPDGSAVILYFDPPGKVAAAGKVAPPGQRPVPPDVAVASVQPTAPAAPATPAPVAPKPPSVAVAAPAVPAAAETDGVAQAIRQACRAELDAHFEAATREHRLRGSGPAYAPRRFVVGDLYPVCGPNAKLTEDIKIGERQLDNVTQSFNRSSEVLQAMSETSVMYYKAVLCVTRWYETPQCKAVKGAVTGSQVAAAGNISPGAGGTFSGTCKSAYDQQEAEFGKINARAPQSNALIPPLQTALYMTSQRMALLNQLCKGQPQYAEYALMQRQHADAMKACLSVASSSQYCNANPSRPGW